ncbi:MAG: cytochrome c biogenesis protein CcsA [Planctomycetes bacterium]|nr:cytochrome c biogenesis protein CcsA [Planctomycetota bacterium]
MRLLSRVRPVDVIVVLAIAGLAGWLGMRRPAGPKVEASAFARAVDLEPLFRTAVQADGRLRSFESHAKTFMGYVSGPRRIHGQSYGFTYLDLMLRPGEYADTDIIHVKNPLVRRQIVDVLRGHGAIDEPRADAIQTSGLVSRALLARPEVSTLLDRLGQDLIRSSKAVDAIQSALTVSDARFLVENLRLVAPPSGEVDMPWLSLSELAAARGLPQDDVHAGVSGKPAPIPGLDPQLQQSIAESWNKLRSAWVAEDAAAVNVEIARIAGMVPTVSPGLYPAAQRLAMESWYFRNQSMTWVWLIYLASVVPLLISVVYRWDGARRTGMVLFAVAFAAHSASLGVRWYISGRWPNSNMFEAVTTSAWFGGVAALILERVARRSALRNLFALGSAVMSMAALMAAYFLPAQLDSAINNKMAALNDVWLYIHTNMIIWSYAVIGIACVPALLFLRGRWVQLWEQGLASRARLAALPVALGVLNYTAYLLLMHVIDNPGHGLQGRMLLGTAGAFWLSALVVLFEIFAARARREAGVAIERSASGGASALIFGGGGGQGFLASEKPTTGQVFDAATMVLVELSFIMLWTGIVMGAIWADHSWGRPWGWDPKEVFALNTFLIFLILIHVRLKVRDKGFWTAVLAVLGFEVMMFNWIVVNFVISGLHSYA